MYEKQCTRSGHPQCLLKVLPFFFFNSTSADLGDSSYGWCLSNVMAVARAVKAVDHRQGPL